MQNKKLLKIGKTGFMSALAGTLLLAFAAPARGDVVTWTFRGKVIHVGQILSGASDINGTVPLGTAMTFKFTFDTSTPGAPFRGDPAAWDYPLVSGQFAASAQFGPYTFASTPASSGLFVVHDDTLGGDILRAQINSASEVFGPSIDNCPTAASATMGWQLSGINSTAVVGTAIPLTPFDLSLAGFTVINVNIRTCGSLYLVQANITEIVKTPCDALTQLLTRVAGAGLPNGTTQSLIAKLSAASQTICDDNAQNDSQARGVLGAFQNELAAQSGKKIPPALAASLSADAQAILNSLPN